MATIIKCDKCDKIISEKERSNSLGLMSLGQGYDVRKKYKLPTALNFCSDCSKSIAKYLKRQLKKA